MVQVVTASSKWQTSMNEVAVWLVSGCSKLSQKISICLSDARLYRVPSLNVGIKRALTSSCPVLFWLSITGRIRIAEYFTPI